MGGETVAFRAEWSEEVRGKLRPVANTATSVGTSPAAAPNALRVPESLRVGNSDDYYSPRYLSLGPYYHDKKLKGGDSEVNKIRYVAALCEKWRNEVKNGKQVKVNGDILDGITKDIEKKVEAIKNFYKCSIEKDDYSNFALMMAVDSLFLLQFLNGKNRGEYGSSIKCDILMLENQIPLFVLKEMFDRMKEALVFERQLDEEDTNIYLARKAYTELSPFDITADHELSMGTIAHPHLLGYMHEIVSQFLLKKDVNHDRDPPVLLVDCLRKPTLFQFVSSNLVVPVVEKMCKILFFPNHKDGDLLIKEYTATELAMAGIKFKAFSTASQWIRFDQYTNKFYLPQMTVTYPLQTEVFFKNLLALESVDSAKYGNSVRDFIQLMDCLIDTSEDVRKLRMSHVIRLGRPLKDENLAEIWDKMIQPFFRGQLEPPGGLKSALDDVLRKKCCMIKCRIALLKWSLGWYEQYLSKPWNVVGLLVGIFVLAMNIIQAYCSLCGCNSRSSI